MYSRVPLSALPSLAYDRFKQTLSSSMEEGKRILGFWSLPTQGGFILFTALLDPESHQVSVYQCPVSHSYPSLTPDIPCLHWFERDIYERHKVLPQGHPWLKKIRFYEGNVGIENFFQVQGEELHEVAVGPVHAGVIEPGHFRFQCHGEVVLHLEISLGYQHRGIEAAFCSGYPQRRVHYAETLAGDTSIGHATSYAMVVESLSGVRPSPYAEWIRVIALELERLANHVGDIGALSGDIGFLPTQNYCGRIRGDILNLTALLCGNRFGRNLVRPGGVRFGLEPSRREVLRDRLKQIEEDTVSAIELFFETPSVRARLEGAGVLPAEVARTFGLVGVAARASGLPIDARTDAPWGTYVLDRPSLVTHSTGDCYARALVRWREIGESFKFLFRITESEPPEGELIQPLSPLEQESIGMAIVEGWRGEIFHIAATDSTGNFSWYRVFDPSFHNWFGLACAMRNGEISDFPLCNKSFNLSYCGHDL